MFCQTSKMTHLRRCAPRASSFSRDRTVSGGRVLEQEQPFLAARHDDRAALEVRVVAPRAVEAGAVVPERNGVEETHLLRVLDVGDVEDPEPLYVVRLV